MQINKLKLFVNFIIFLLISGSTIAQDIDKKIYFFEIEDEISKVAVHRTQKAIKESKEIDADLIILRLNTYGGGLEQADTIRTAILNSEIPFWVFIDNNAASAGALISIACDKIFMRKGSSIGAATVVDQTGAQVPDKYQSYMRSMMRSTAEAKNRNPDIAEAMVDASIEVKGVSEAGKVITFTATEALKHGFCDQIAESTDEILKSNDITSYEIVEQELTSTDKIIEFLTSSIVSGILILMIVGGIYLEFQSPGSIFPIVIAAIGALLYFTPLFIEGLAAHWEIAIFIVGIILLAVEIFAIPGFGVFGISGITLMIMGLAFSMIDNIYFKFPVDATLVIIKSFGIVIIAAFFGIILSFFAAKRLFGLDKGLFSKFVLKESQTLEKGYHTSAIDYEQYIGKVGVAYTMLRPAGKIKVENKIYDATALISFINKDEEIKIVSYSHAQFMVVKNKEK